AQRAWVPDPVPTRLVAREPTKEGVAVEPEVYVDLRQSWSVEERVHADFGIAGIVDTRLATIAKDAHEPAVRVEASRCGGVRAVVLRPAHDVIGRVCADRQALVLERLESRVHRCDRRRHLREPVLTVD